MINREVTYERTVNRSYMKIPACVENTFDENLMLRKTLAGILPMEKCYFNGSGQYWYNITGKQALDSYTRVKELGGDFVETLLLNICSKLESLEWNLLDTNCLVLEPEFIFISNGNQEIFFTLYPENKGDVFQELSKLMEYLLTKLDHKDPKGVKVAYDLYELTLNRGYSLSDIKMLIEKTRAHEGINENKREEYRPAKEEKKPEHKEYKEVAQPAKQVPELAETYLRPLITKCKQLFERIPMRTERVQQEEEILVAHPQTQRNPTICLMNGDKGAKGVLLHEGKGSYPDCEFGESGCLIGNNYNADLFIEKETVSYYHARIEHMEGEYLIEDLNSTNGTFINEEPVPYKQKKLLSSGDVVRFADVKYRFL